MAKRITYDFKIGDDFLLPFTVTSKDSPAGISAQAVVSAAQIAYDTALAANPQVPLTISTAQSALIAAQEAYALAIIVNISTWTIESSIKWCGKLIDTFTVVKTDPSNGKFTIGLSNTLTTVWKPRMYEVNVQFTINGFKRSAETFNVLVGM